MTTRGRLIAGTIAVLAVALLPKHVECDQHDMGCAVIDSSNRLCRRHAEKPFAIYLLETAVRRDLGLAYSTGLQCE